MENSVIQTECMGSCDFFVNLKEEKICKEAVYKVLP